MQTLLGKSRIDKSNLVKLGHAGWAVACEVFYPSHQWTTKNCKIFMGIGEVPSFDPQGKEGT